MTGQRAAAGAQGGGPGPGQRRAAQVEPDVVGHGGRLEGELRPERQRQRDAERERGPVGRERGGGPRGGEHRQRAQQRRDEAAAI